MYYINVSLWYQSLVDHFLSDSHLRPQRTIPEKGTGIKNCILNFQEQEWETGIPDSHSQLLGDHSQFLGDWYSRKNIFRCASIS